jgi:hypothetical protein
LKINVRKGVKIGLGIAITIVVLVVLFIFYTLDPIEQPIFPRCPFLLLTGYECPGCGSQRAIHSLLHFDFKAAFHYNALMVLAIPYILVGIYLQYFGGSRRHPQGRENPLRPLVGPHGSGPGARLLDRAEPVLGDGRYNRSFCYHHYRNLSFKKRPV